MSNNIEVTLSDDQFTKLKNLQQEGEVTYDQAIVRAVDTQTWVEEKQAAGKTILAATGTDSEDDVFWSEYEFLGENVSPEETE